MSNVSKLSRYYKDEISLKDRFIRILWSFIRFNFCFFPSKFVFKLYRLVLLSFGAKVGIGSKIYPSPTFILPSNLAVGNFTCIGPTVCI